MPANQNPKPITKDNHIFMPAVFNETMQLLSDAHEYFHLFGKDDESRLRQVDPNFVPLYNAEMSRITLRLSSIMAWVMVQRAIFTGKIEARDACTRYALDFTDICLVDNQLVGCILPSYVQYLLQRSLELYQRVNRLDQQARNQ